MFKVKDKWKLSILEEYGFSKEIKYYDGEHYYATCGCGSDALEYEVDIVTRELKIIVYMDDYFSSENITSNLYLFYKLIKDGIIEEGQ